MQVKSVINTNSSVNFNSREDLQKAYEFVNMNDEQLNYCAHAASIDKKQEKKDKKSILKIFLAIPFVDTIATAILAQRINIDAKTGAIGLAKPHLSDRVVAAGAKGSFWLLALGMVSGYGALKQAFIPKDSSLYQFEQNHPVFSFIADIGILVATMGLSLKGLVKLDNKAAEKYPEQYEKTLNRLGNALTKLDKTKLNEEILPKIEKKIAQIAEKAPFVKKTGEFALRNSIWILFGAAIFKMVQQTRKRNDKVQENYRILKKAQTKTAKDLVNILSVEEVALIQNQIKMAHELKQANEEKLASGEEISRIKHKIKDLKAELEEMKAQQETANDTSCPECSEDCEKISE